MKARSEVFPSKAISHRLRVKRVYRWISAACVVGYAWLAYRLWAPAQSYGEVCFVKNVTGHPCPSCGSTRSALHILQGDVTTALVLNPIGFLIMGFLLIAPLWLTYDGLRGRNSLAKAYFRLETFLQKPPVLLILVLLILANWIWNFYKGY